MLSTEPQTTTVGGDAVDARLAAGGDTKAFERLYRGHAGRIQGLARRMMGTDEAVDVAQEVFVRAWQKLNTFRGESAFGTWLHRLAVNLILSRRSSANLRRSRHQEGDEVIDILPGRAAPTDQRMDFDSAIVKLPEGARQVFVLHDVEGYKHEEIATLLGVAVGTSKAQLHRARMILRRHLES